MGLSSHIKKKRGTEMLMEKRFIHDMECLLQTVINSSDTRSNILAKELVSSGIIDEGIRIVFLDEVILTFDIYIHPREAERNMC